MHTVVSSPAGADPAPEGTAALVQGVKSRPFPVPPAPPALRAASREPGARGRERTAPGAAVSVVAAARAGGVGPPGAALAGPERGAANGGRGAARGLERARGGPAGPGEGRRRGGRCQRGYKGGKSSLRWEPGRRTLVRRPQRQGGAAEEPVAAEDAPGAATRSPRGLCRTS